MTQIIPAQDTLQNTPPALVADLQPQPPAMTFERYAQLVLLAQKYFGGKPARALADAEASYLQKLFTNYEEGDEDLWRELRLAHRIALFGGKLRKSCGMAEASNEELFPVALEAAQATGLLLDKVGQ